MKQLYRKELVRSVIRLPSCTSYDIGVLSSEFTRLSPVKQTEQTHKLNKGLHKNHIEVLLVYFVHLL